MEFFEGKGMLLNADLKGVACLSGSACTSRSLKASRVLPAMGFGHALAQRSLVFSLPETTVGEAIDHVLEVFPPIIDKLRRMSPLYTKYLEE
jgi:cysteine desulfurase